MVTCSSAARPSGRASTPNTPSAPGNGASLADTIRHVGTSDRNFYDRYYFLLHASSDELLMVMGLFILGAITLLVGIILLITRSAGKEVRSLATQTAKLAKKGIAEDVAGLVGNASNLLSATNELVRTSAGIGVFLAVLGFLLMAAATWLVLQIS